MDILIKGMKKPKDCKDCQLATVGSFSTWCPLKNCYIKKGYSFKDCPLVEVNLDGFTRVIVTSGDGTVVGYKDVSARQVLRIGGTDSSNAFPLVESNTEAST